MTRPLCPHVSLMSLRSMCPVGPYVPYIHIRDIRDINNLIVRARARAVDNFEGYAAITALAAFCTGTRT